MFTGVICGDQGAQHVGVPHSMNYSEVLLFFSSLPIRLGILPSILGICMGARNVSGITSENFISFVADFLRLLIATTAQ